MSDDPQVTIRTTRRDLAKVEQALNAQGLYLKRHPTAAPGFFTVAPIPPTIRNSNTAEASQHG